MATSNPLQYGRMTKQRMAVTMPLDTPIFPDPPYHYRDTQRMVFIYETDREAALDLLPEGLELELPAVASMVFLEMPMCTLGAYNEVYVSLRATFQGEPVEYVVWNLLTSDAALAAGREIWGVPKKLACTWIERHPEGMVGIVERPKGTRICTAMFRPERLISPDDHPILKKRRLLCVRIIPDPAGGEPLIQLIEHLDPKTNNFQAGEDWWKNQFRGPGSVSFPAQSVIDPWHKLPVLRMIDAYYSGGHSSTELPYGKVLRTY
jgi:acetoacetate decarboxylase